MTLCVPDEKQLRGGPSVGDFRMGEQVAGFGDIANDGVGVRMDRDGHG